MPNDPEARPADTQVSYFVTVRTFGCRTVFDDATKASTLVDLIETVRREQGFKKYGYVVLPDHYHVLFGGGPDSRSVADVIWAINHAVERFVETADDGQPLWDDEPEVLVLYSARTRLEKLNYMHHKPVLCGVAANAQDYAFSSARFYYERYGKTEF
jgi:putative transposase